MPTTQSSSKPTRLREAHAHITSFGESLALLNLANCNSVESCLNTIAGLSLTARGHNPRTTRAGWILAFGARIESWTEHRWPTLRELDDATNGAPCIIMSFDHHSACANSLALARAGLTAGQHVDPSGLVVATSDGQPTGVLLEHAAYKAWNTAPEPTLEDRRAHVLTSLRALASLGYVEVHDMLSQPWLGPILHDLECASELPVESVWLYPPVDAFDSAHQSWESTRIRLAGAKLFADGTLNSRTALMLHDYRDALPQFPRGQAMVSPAQIDAALRKVSDASSPDDPTAARGHLAVHAIGDGAVRAVLDAIERTKPRPDSLGITARIEHCELIDAADVPRFASLGVVASVQPCHLLYDGEALTRYLPHRLDRVLPLRDLIDTGCHTGMLTPAERRARRSRHQPCGELWFGSDVPIVRPNPEDSITAATRRAAAGSNERAPLATIAPTQLISESQARQCFATDNTRS